MGVSAPASRPVGAPPSWSIRLLIIAAVLIGVLVVLLVLKSGRREPKVAATEAEQQATPVAIPTAQPSPTDRVRKEVAEILGPLHHSIREIQGASSAGVNYPRFLELSGKAHAALSEAHDRIMASPNKQRLAPIESAYLVPIAEYELIATVWRRKIDESSREGLYAESSAPSWVKAVASQFGVEPHEYKGERYYYLDTIISAGFTEASNKADQAHALFMASSTSASAAE